MKSVRIAVVIAAVLAAPTWARSEGAEATRLALDEATSAAIDSGRYGEAYDLANDLVARYPEDARARYLAAAAAMQVFRRAEARGHLEAGIAAHPADVDLLGLRAYLLLAEGDDTASRLDVARALELNPEAVWALAVKEEIELSDRARIRLDGKDPGLESGSAVAFVDRVCERIANGATGSELATYLDLEIVGSLDAAERNHYALANGMKMALEMARADRDEARPLGWFVLPDATQDGDRHYVTVQIPMITRIDQQQRMMFESAYADPGMREAIDPATRALLDGVDDAERAAMLDRMVGSTNRMLAHVEFELISVAGGGYRITDVSRDGVSLKENLARYAEIMKKVDPDSGEVRPSKDIAYQLGRTVGSLGVVALILWLVLRGRRTR